jgi:hypothetical protein
MLPLSGAQKLAQTEAIDCQEDAKSASMWMTMEIESQGLPVTRIESQGSRERMMLRHQPGSSQKI